jgi:hypothetical protein
MKVLSKAIVTEIRHFEVIVLIKENVLGFDIAMDDVFGVQVTQSTDHLVEDGASYCLTEGAKLQDLSQVIRGIFKDEA